MRRSSACARIPGSGNAMASVKINFPSPDGVYMHDTPQQSLFSKLMRFDSSGCVRVQNVRDLVTWLLRDTPGWTRQHFEATIKSGENTPVELAGAGAGLFHLHLGLVDRRRRRAVPRRHLWPRRRRRAADLVDAASERTALPDCNKARRKAGFFVGGTCALRGLCVQSSSAFRCGGPSCCLGCVHGRRALAGKVRLENELLDEALVHFELPRICRACPRSRPCNPASRFCDRSLQSSSGSHVQDLSEAA